MRPTAFALCSITYLGLLAGCTPGTGTVVPGLDDQAGGEITDATRVDVERAFYRLAPSDPARERVRDALIRYRNRDGAAVLARGNYDEVVEHFEELTELLGPADLEPGHVPEALRDHATFIITRGSPRGDEGRVMAAHLLLERMGDDPERHRAERERIATWGREVRAQISNPLERYQTLAEVWQQHVLLAPSADAVETLAQVFVEQRDALNRAFGPGQDNPPFAMMNPRQLEIVPALIQRAPLDVAAVHLRYGDLPGAVRAVRAMGERGGLEWRLAEILERAQAENPEGAESLGELAQGFARARPEVSEAICHLGVRRFEADGRFPLCLARAAAASERPGLATAWYAEAVRLAPTERDVYDEAIGQLGEMMEEGVFETDVTEVRAIAGHALTILEERTRRWPSAPASVSRDQLLLQIGRAEMSAGNLDRAQSQLEASLEARETSEAHFQLGVLLERRAEPEPASRHYRRALDMTEDVGPDGQRRRAQLIEHIGDAFRRMDNEQQARRYYRQALELWGGLVEQVEGPQRALIEVRRGVLQSRLGDEEAAEDAFTDAMEAAPSWREPYAAILSHLVVSTPNVELARTVFRRAQFQLTLEREWRVYFALWVQAIEARAADRDDHEVEGLLAELSEGDEWSARLAAFGRNELDYGALRAAAADDGQRAEADFYQGARRLGEGDVNEARHLFEQVIRSGLVNFYEYAMAQELLADLPHATDGHVAEQ